MSEQLSDREFHPAPSQPSSEGTGEGATSSESVSEPTFEHSDAPPGVTSPGERRRSRRGRRGGRRRRRGREGIAGEPRVDAASAEAQAPEVPPLPHEPYSAADSFPAEQRAEGASARPEGQSRRGRRGGRRRQRQGGTRPQSSEPAARPAEPLPFEDEEPPNEQRGSGTEPRGARHGGGDAARTRKRGSRGGRRRRNRGVTARPHGAVQVEIIPGDDDELPELAELPEDAVLVGEPTNGAGPSARPAPAAVADEEEDLEDEDEPPRRTEPHKKRVILVNARDSEEKRVAVIEEGRIVDLQMTVKKHVSYVNDIYRGRVVNIESAIGAAFVDFGEGRNGFLHASDVLPSYGEPDWNLEKLLSTPVA